MISFRKKRVGIRIGPHGITGVEIKGSRPEISRIWTKKFAPDHGFSSLNRPIIPPLSESGFKCGSISFSIMDIHARVNIFDFDELPKSDIDANEIVKGRAAKALGIEGNNYIHVFQPLSAKAGIRVLSVMVRKDIVGALKEAAEKAGFSIRNIGIDSFNLVNLLPSEDEDAVLLLREADSLVIAFFRAGSLDFYRCKGIDRDDLETMKREIAFSLTFYIGKNPDIHMQKAYTLCDTEKSDSEIAGILPQGMMITSIGTLVSEGLKIAKNDMSILLALGACL